MNMTMVCLHPQQHIKCVETHSIDQRSDPPRRRTYLHVELVKGHDGAEEEEGQVEVVLEQVQEGVAAFLAVAVLQGEAHAAHDGEAAAAVKQDVLQVEGARHQRLLGGRGTAWVSLSGCV